MSIIDKMLKAYHYRLYPNQQHQTMFAKHFGCNRFVYNWALEIKTEAYAKENKSLSRFDLQSQMLQLKAENIWLKEVNSQTLQSSLLNLDTAFSNFFRRCKQDVKEKGYPTFKTRKGRQSFQCPQNVTVDFEHGKISFPKIKEVKCTFSRQFTGTMKTVTVSRTPANRYFVSILVETKDTIPSKPKITRETAIGIDLGLKDFAILSTGEKIPNPRFNEKEQPKLKRLNRRISRQSRMNDKHTNNRNKNCIKRARLFEKISNRKNDFLHKLSSRIVSENQTICIEDLNIAGMMKNHKVAGSFASVSLSTFVNYLEYKSEWYGKNIVRINRFDPSSRISNCCGDYNHNLKLSDRSWVCRKCGKTLDRDVNAANNIKDFALDKQNLITQIPRATRESTLQERKPLHSKKEVVVQVSSVNEESAIL